jgi:hypothetical protein
VVDLYGAAIELAFDPAVVEVVDADPGTAGIQIAPGTCPSPDFVVQNSADNSTGAILYDVRSLSPSPPCSGDGVIAQITFHGILPDADSDVEPISWLLSDVSGIPIPTATQAGSLHVSSSTRIEGVVTLQGRTDHSGTEVCALDGATPVACTMVDAAGAFALDVPEGTYTVQADRELYLYAERSSVVVTAGATTTLPSLMLRGGDAVEDELVNIQDLAFMGARYGTSCGDPGWNPLADINGDCAVNILDVAMTGGNYMRSGPQPWP